MQQIIQCKMETMIYDRHTEYLLFERNDKMSKVIMGFVLKDRIKNASAVQELLTEYGCEINTRIGLPVASEDACSPNGLILLEFIDNAQEKAEAFERELKKIATVDVQKMIF